MKLKSDSPPHLSLTRILTVTTCTCITKIGDYCPTNQNWTKGSYLVLLYMYM